MRRFLSAMFALVAIACGSNGDDPPRSCGSGFLTPPGTLNAPMGRMAGFVTGTVNGNLTGQASAYEQGSSTTGFTVLDGYQVDAAHRPVSELFVFLRSPMKATETTLVPVTLAQLRDNAFVPSGSFAVYAEGYDAAVGDYTRWLLATSGCLRVSPQTTESPFPWLAAIVLTGEWRRNSGELIGPGSGSVLLQMGVRDFSADPGQLRDTVTATVTGVRTRPFAWTTVDAFQVLHPSQTRMVIVATQPADTTRELWLSIDGVPQVGDSVPLDAATLEEAKAGRATPPRSFAMLRMLQLDNIGNPVVRELWRSTIGFVKFESVSQGGPLALCGWASGRFAVTTQGTSLASPGTSLGESGIIGGVFSTRFTILSPSDTLVDGATLPPSPRRMRAAAPSSTQGFGCP